MKVNSQMWKGILALDYADVKTRRQKIVLAISTAIIEENIIEGELIPAYRELAKLAGVGNKVMENALKILKDRDRLLVTIKGKGTYVIAPIHYSCKSKLKDHEAMDQSGKQQILFNQETLLSSDVLVKKIDTCLKNGSNQFRMMDSAQRKIKIIPELVEGVTLLLNHSLATRYNVEEVHYTQDYALLIHNICEVTLSNRKAFVMAKPAMNLVYHAVVGLGKDISFTASDADGMCMDSLEKTCRKSVVGLVYLSSRTIYPIAQSLPLPMILRLLELQVLYNFTIIEDDRYADFFQQTPNLLMKLARRTNAKVIYLRPLSCFHPEQMDFKIIAAPVKISKALKVKFRNGGKGVSAVLAQAINLLLKNKLLNNHDPKIHNAIAITRDKAIQILGSSGLWNKDRLTIADGWYLHLELMLGDFPDHIREKLTAANISVMDSSEYQFYHERRNVIRISLAGYLDGMHLDRDLKVFNDLFRK